MKHPALLLILSFLIIYYKADSAYLGPQILYKKYFETLPQNLKSEEEGFLYGFRGGLSSRGLSSNSGKFIDADLYTEYAEGKTKYTGTRQSLKTKKITPFESFTDNKLFDTEGTIGFPLPYKKITIKPFWGLGYHLWERKMEDYTETFSWIYYHFGGILSLTIVSPWEIGLEAKGMQTKFANIAAREIFPWQLDISVENHLQYSLKAYNRFHSKYFDVYLAAFYRNLKIGPDSIGPNTIGSDVRGHNSNKRKRAFSAPLSTDKLLGGEFILEYNF